MKKILTMVIVSLLIWCGGNAYGAESEKEAFVQGVAYGQQGNYGAAVKSFSKAIELKPDFAEAYYNRGFAYYIKGKKDKALADFNKALELRPDLAEVRLIYQKKVLKKRSPIMIKRSNWTPRTSALTATGDGLTRRRAISRKPWRTIRRPFRSTRSTAGLTMTGG
ncbi:MAG: tetratricopeptide repeat protein [Candidatus Omnitrophica bacterium]|nr:tetratricopeptide repeat protein [Candidatus Omnitrophota bacterium]